MELVEENKEAVGDGAYLQISNWLMTKFKDEKDEPQIVTGQVHRPVAIRENPVIEEDEWAVLRCLRTITFPELWNQSSVLRHTAAHALTRNALHFNRFQGVWQDCELSSVFKTHEAFLRYYRDWHTGEEILQLWCMIGWKEQLNKVHINISESTCFSDALYLFRGIFTNSMDYMFQESFLDEIRQWKGVAKALIMKSIQNLGDMSSSVCNLHKYGTEWLVDDDSRRPIIVCQHKHKIVNGKHTLVERDTSKLYRLRFDKITTTPIDFSELELYTGLIQYNQYHKIKLTIRLRRWMMASWILKEKTPEMLEAYSKIVVSMCKSFDTDVMPIVTSGNNKHTRGQERMYYNGFLHQHITIVGAIKP